MVAQIFVAMLLILLLVALNLSVKYMMKRMILKR